MSKKNRSTIGMELMDHLDPTATDSLRQSFQNFAPDLVDFVVDFAYGDIMSRDGLDLETRELCIIASLTAMGSCEHELEIHIKKALHIEIPKHKIVEVLLQQIVYSGFPKAINALLVAKRLFEEK